MASESLAEAEHAIALRIAEPLRKLTLQEVERSIVEWIGGASIIRDAIVKARRALKNRARSPKTPANTNHSAAGLIGDIATEVVLRAVGKRRLDELAAGEFEHIKTACKDAWQACREVDEQALAQGLDSSGAAGAASWTAIAVAGASAYAHATGTYVMASIASPAILTVGKHNPVMHIAALALAEVGIPTPDVHRILQSARPGELKSRAQIRRLTRAARVS